MRNLPAFRIWPFNEAAAREFGRLAALLKQMGRPMQQIDIQIAAIALSLGNCTVVTKDSDRKRKSLATRTCSPAWCEAFTFPGN
jgi:predicted nucleic acid-binding protein